MTALPKKKHTRARRGNKRSHKGLTKINGYMCSECGEPRIPHAVCKSCGEYNGRNYHSKEEESVEEEVTQS
ncbi:MAG: 50S ribosomal protein L32 [Chloroflexota bacterium]|nr:50S ribosomal protein L32 [Chloroflexota bacterium]